MTTRIAVGSTIAIRVYCWQPDEAQLGINDFAYNCTGVTGGGAYDTDAVGQFSVAIGPYYTALLCNAAQFYGCGANTYGLVGPPGITVFSGAGRSMGAAGAGLLPTQVRGLIQRRTETGGRGGRGRIYTPFPTVVDNTVQGRPGGDYHIHLEQLAAAMLVTRTFTSLGNTSVCVPVLFNVKSRATKLIVAASSIFSWATQRRSGNLGRTNSLPF